MEVVDVENWRIDNSRVFRWTVSLIEWNSSVSSTTSSIQSTFRVGLPEKCYGDLKKKEEVKVISQSLTTDTQLEILDIGVTKLSMVFEPEEDFFTTMEIGSVCGMREDDVVGSLETVLEGSSLEAWRTSTKFLSFLTCLSDETLAIPLDKIQIDEKLYFIEETVEIMDREVKRLKLSRIPNVKVRWNSSRGPEFT
ncbi:hypothetical protein Tco_0512346 [Tanacetum coccineum]